MSMKEYCSVSVCVNILKYSEQHLINAMNGWQNHISLFLQKSPLFLSEKRFLINNSK